MCAYLHCHLTLSVACTTIAIIYCFSGHICGNYILLWLELWLNTFIDSCIVFICMLNVVIRDSSSLLMELSFIAWLYHLSVSIKLFFVCSLAESRSFFKLYIASNNFYFLNYPAIFLWLSVTRISLSSIDFSSYNDTILTNKPSLIIIPVGFLTVCQVTQSLCLILSDTLQVALVNSNTHHTLNIHVHTHGVHARTHACVHTLPV